MSDLTLQEAIRLAKEVAEKCDDNHKCKMEHLQLAEWLKELLQARVENERLKAEAAVIRAEAGTTLGALCAVEIGLKLNCSTKCENRIDDNGICINDDDCNVGILIALIRKVSAPVGAEWMERMMKLEQVAELTRIYFTEPASKKVTDAHIELLQALAELEGMA